MLRLQLATDVVPLMTLTIPSFYDVERRRRAHSSASLSQRSITTTHQLLPCYFLSCDIGLQGGPKMAPFLYALTLPNINRS